MHRQFYLVFLILATSVLRGQPRDLEVVIWRNRYLIFPAVLIELGVNGQATSSLAPADAIVFEVVSRVQDWCWFCDFQKNFERNFYKLSIQIHLNQQVQPPVLVELQKTAEGIFRVTSRLLPDECVASATFQAELKDDGWDIDTKKLKLLLSCPTTPDRLDSEALFFRHFNSGEFKAASERIRSPAPKLNEYRARVLSQSPPAEEVQESKPSTEKVQKFEERFQTLKKLIERGKLLGQEVSPKPERIMELNQATKSQTSSRHPNSRKPELELELAEQAEDLARVRDRLFKIQILVGVPTKDRPTDRHSLAGAKYPFRQQISPEFLQQAFFLASHDLDKLAFRRKVAQRSLDEISQTFAETSNRPQDNPMDLSRQFRLENRAISLLATHRLNLQSLHLLLAAIEKTGSQLKPNWRQTETELEVGESKPTPDQFREDTRSRAFYYDDWFAKINERIEAAQKILDFFLEFRPENPTLLSRTQKLIDQLRDIQAVAEEGRSQVLEARKTLLAVNWAKPQSSPDLEKALKVLDESEETAVDAEHTLDLFHFYIVGLEAFVQEELSPQNLRNNLIL